jgi:hypothetical protein
VAAWGSKARKIVLVVVDTGLMTQGGPIIKLKVRFIRGQSLTASRGNRRRKVLRNDRYTLLILLSLETD